LIGRFSSAATAVLISQVVGFMGVSLLLVTSGEAVPGTESLLWGAAAGASGVIGVGCFYFALSRGTMGLIAPLAALIGAGIPVLVSVIGGESLEGLRLIGVGVALVSVVLISLPGPAPGVDERARLRLELAELPLVIVSGLGFAGFFLFLDRATQGGEEWWPLFVVRLVGVLLIVAAILVLALRRTGSWRERANSVLGLQGFAERWSSGRLAVVLLVILAGAGDLGGNVFYVLAVGADALSVAVVLASLYPIVTTTLAAIFLHERLSRLQIAGVVLATLSVPLLR
jgi:drug/metabolite transporter (DMT)-like permease